LLAFACGDNDGMKVVRRRRPAGERQTQVRRVVEEGTAPPQGPPVGPWLDRELWPWLLVLLVLVVGGIVGAVLLTRDHHKKSAPATTVVVASTPVRTVTVGRTTPTSTGQQQTPAVARVKVANLLGVPAATAVRRLQQDGLQPVVKSVFSTKPRGVVAAQEPGAGTRVAEGSAVTLSVSKGQPAKPVPDVVGQTETQAVALLKAAGFAATPVEVPSSETKGNVVAQKPTAGGKAQPGTKVRLNVSAGPTSASTTTPSTTPTTTVRAASTPTKTTTAPRSQPATVTVPDVEGKTLSQARLAMHNAGLVMEIRYVPNDQPTGTVVAQARQPGSTAKRGDHMLVTVSLGGATASGLATVPDVVGQAEAAAQTRLQTAGFAAVVEDVPTTDSSQVGKVVDEQPAPGTKAPKGSQIIIYVGRASTGG
jgi:beta-lactam-binding protein with PASTA domain